MVTGGSTLGPLVREFLADRRAVGVYTHDTARIVARRFVSLDRHFGRRPLNQLTDRMVESWLASIGHLAPNSRAAYVSTVRMFTRWLVDRGKLRADPCASLPPQKRARSVPRALSAEEMERLFAVCRDDRDRAIIWLEYGVGLRRVEVARACWEDYDPERRILLVHGKGGKERIVPLLAPVADAVERLRVRGNTGPILRSKNDPAAGLTPQTVGRLAVELMYLADVKHVPWDGRSGHALRHTAASDTLDADPDLTIVQEMLGHASLPSTAIYLRRANLTRMRRAMEGRILAGTTEPAPRAA